MFKSSRALMLALLLVRPAFGAEASPDPPLQFTNYVSLAPFDQAVVADFNADGFVDIFAASRAIFHWNNGTNFSLAGPYEGGTFGLAAAAGDFDGDNAVDLYTGWPIFRSGSVRSNHFSIWWNGTGRNTNSPSPFVPTLLGNSAAADYDNDGDLDLMITGNTNRDSFLVGAGLARLYENLGSREFTPHLAPFPRFERGVVSWADYDSDGDMDLLLSGMTNQNSAATILYRNDDGALTNSGIQFPRIAEGSASWADYDGDNDLDLLLTGRTNDIRFDRPHAAIYRNEAGAFTPVSFGATNISRVVLSAWADFDVDGDLDIVASEPYSQSLRFYLNNGNDTFIPSTNKNAQGGYMIPADLNNDGLFDLVSHNLDWPIYTVLNVFWRSNTPPSAPANPIATPSNGTVTFSWNSSSDTEQPAGLTYNLRIGTAPGKADIMSAMANPTNGVRFIPHPGNTGLRTNWTIKNLPVGTYYWSVQAIDLGLKGSVFAEEQTFTITNAPPFGRTLSFANITPQGALVEVRVNPNGAPTSFYLEYISPNATATTDVRQFEAGTSNLFSRILLSGLEPSTPYQVWLVVSNSFGVVRSGPASFNTAPATVLTEFPMPFPILVKDTAFHPVDFDQDGDLDLVTSGVYQGLATTNKVFLNDRGLFYESDASIPIPPFASTTGWLTASADFNNDALLDWIIFSGFDFGMLLQTTNRTFQARQMTEFTMPSWIHIADADNDGDLDLASSVPFPLHTVGLYANDNIPRFRPTSVRYGGGQFLEWADYDADGDNDVLISGSTNNSQSLPNYAVTRIFPSDGASILANAHTNLPGALWGASWDDYDNDGDLDIALVHVTNYLSSSTNHLRLFRNDATNGFIDAGKIASEPALGYLQWIDFNRDGLKDIFLIQDLDRADRLRLYLNNGIEEFSRQFSEFDLGLPPLTNVQAKFADIDGDLMPDLLVSAMATNQSQRVRIFRNNLTSTNPAPPIPIATSLTSIVARTSATLHWQTPHAIDDINRIAYTFNLRIGTTPGGSEIMSAMSHPLTGARYLPQRGNAGQTGTWTIRDLPPGTYYWSVQSVDHAHNGSRFSEEASFTIAPYERPPQILAITISTNGLPQLTLDGPTRSRAQVHRSLDLLNWIPATGYTYIGGDPATYTAPQNDTRFYRFLLLD